MVQHYAKANEIDLVMHYNDLPVHPPGQWNPSSFRRPSDEPCCKPAYLASGVDITQNIIDALNDRHREKKEVTKPDKR